MSPREQPSLGCRPAGSTRAVYVIPRVYRRLGMLASAGWIERQDAFYKMPGLYLPTRRGMSLLQGELSLPRIDFRQLDHDLGLVELGTDAELTGDRVLTDREIRAISRLRGPWEEPNEYVLEGIRPWRGMPAELRRSPRWPNHYPDQIRFTADGRQIAVELERSEKGIDRLRAILEGYRREASIDRVLYYVTRPVAARRIGALVDDLLMADKTEVILWKNAPAYAMRTGSRANAVDRSDHPGSDLPAACHGSCPGQARRP